MIKKLMLVAAILSLLLATSCSKKESMFPSQPRSASGVTDASGEVDLDLVSHVVTVSVVNESGGAVGNISVSAYLLHDYLLAFAGGSSSYYANFTLVSYADLQAQDDIVFAPYRSSYQSPQHSEAVNVEVEIVLPSITRDIYSFLDEPEHVDDIYTDSWVTQDATTGTLEDMYTLANGLSLDGGLIVHITDELADTVNAEVKTVSLVMNQIQDFETFAVLLGLEFHIFDADTLRMYSLIHSDSLMPAIFVDSIGMVEGSFFAQFTLTWNENPHDLDSHLWTPNIEGSTYHIYYASKGSGSTPPYAFLDVDDVTSWGPEHIIIYQAFPGTYTYAVHHYSGESNIPNSGAEVSLLKPDRSVQEFTPPDTTAGQGDYWTVCSIDGTTGAVTPINIISPNPQTSAEPVVILPAKPY